MSRILLIDDDPGVRDSMERTLRGAGYSVLSAASGEEGVEMAKGGAYDVILSDMRMPGISGLDILRRLREIRVDAAFLKGKDSALGNDDEAPQPREASFFSAARTRAAPMPCRRAPAATTSMLIRPTGRGR